MVNVDTRQERAAQRLYRQGFLEEPHPSRQIMEKTLKRFRETGSVIHKSRIGRSRRVGQRMQTEYHTCQLLEIEKCKTTCKRLFESFLKTHKQL